MPYRRPPKSPPKSKPAPSPEDVHSGKHAPPHPPPPPPKPAPSPEDVHSGKHSPPHPPAPPAWVVARQRRLRAAGYPVVVDGVWGARSQHFWSQYASGKRPGAHVPDFRAIAQREFAAAERKQQGRLRALPAASTQVPSLAASRSHVADVLHHAPLLVAPDGRASGGTADVEARDLVIRDTRFAVQRERAHAVKVAKAARLKPPEKMSLDDVVALTVDPLTGTFNPQKPSDVRRVQRWLRAHGHASLTVDGVFSSRTFGALRDSYFATKRAEEDHARHQLVSTLYESHVVKPGQNVPGLGRVAGAGELLRELRAGGFGATIAWRRLVELSRDRGLEYLTWRESQLRQYDKQLFGGVRPPDFLTSDLDRYLRIAAAPAISTQGAAQLGILYSSRSFDQAKARLRELRRAELALRRHDQEAQKHHPWWQGALDTTLVKPGEFFRHTIAASTYGVVKSYLDANGRVGPGMVGPDEEARQLGEWFQKNHPWLNLSLELAIDPVNLLPGAVAVGRVGVAGALKLEELGYAIARGGEFIPVAALRPLARTGLALTLPAKTGRAAVLGGSFTLDAFGQTQSGVALRYVAAKATRLKSEGITAARLNVNLALRHGFRPPPMPQGVDAIPAYKFSGDFFSRLDAAKADVSARVEAAFPSLLSALDRSGISLFTDVARREHSGVGAALLARVAEVFRVHEVQRLGLERAQQAFQRVSPDLRPTPEAESAARAAYKDIVTRAGSYIRGAHDPDLAAILRPRVQVNVDRFEFVVFQEFQNALERRALAGERKVFDEATGKWVGRDSVAANELRRLGADAFDPERAIPLPNPLHGRIFTLAERNELIDDEVKGEVGRLKAWYAREAAAGRPRKKEWLHTRVDEIVREANDAWTKTKDGWVDTRATRSVPDIYARQVAHLYGSAANGLDPLLLATDVPHDALQALAQLSKAPVDALGGSVETELQRLAWAFAGGHSLGSLGPKLDPLLTRYAPEGADRGEAAKLRSAVDAMSSILSQGYDEALPQALRSEWALMAALGESQGFVGRNSYRAIKGSMDLWIFATLPFRPGWGVRNIIDNTAKALIRGSRDPRVYGGAGRPGELFSSVFENDLRAVREVATKIDGLFGTDVGARFGRILDTVWEHNSATLDRIFRMHDIRVPEVVLDGARFNPFEEYGTRAPRPFKSERAVDPGVLKRFRDNVWELMASRPENYSKRVIYRTHFARELERGASEAEAFEVAWEEVERTLFDYSKVTILEDNLKPLFPFVQFWRKNTAFWLNTAVTKPWVPLLIARYEFDLKEQTHADLPEWMRRYVHTDEIGDGLGQVPGLAWLGRAITPVDVMTDPLSLFSFAPLYRAFKDDNPLLPADKAGLPFISGFVDALNDWGLSMNPLLRKPLELAGVTNYRAWQSVFPQTPVIQALTRKYLHDRFPNGINIEAMLEDPLAEKLIGESATDLIADNFNQWVQVEMANQAARGERVDREKARRKIEDYFLLQTVVGYFSGIYVRRMSPKDFWLYQLGDELAKGEADYRKLSPTEQRAYQLWKRRKLDAVEFDRYISLIPLIQAYYSQGSYKAKERYKREHPELLAFVEPVWAGKGLATESVVQTAQLVQETGFVVKMLDLASELRLPRDVRAAAEHLLVTPELRAFWTKNDTPAELRDRHLKLLYFEHLEKLNETYFAIPEDDFDAKRGFLAQHPVLAHWWQANNTESDDLKAIINASNATLREVFFEKVKSDGWDSANAFLHEYPFMFEFTKASKKVDPLTGNWIGDGGSGHGHGTTQHARDYLAAKASLDAFFALPESQRSSWLRSGSPAARAVRAYFSKYAHFHGGRGRGRSQHARDYLAAKPYLEQFFKIAKGQGEDAAWVWLHSPTNSKAAKLVQAYFRKYAHPNGHSQHALDYTKAKGALKRYFALKKGRQRSDWLHSGSKDADAVLAYFKKWGATSRYERFFRKSGLLKSSRPELNQRLLFWQRFWQLEPDLRPGFIADHADDYGVFVYGSLGDHTLDRRLNEYLRKALLLGVGEKAAMQVYVKPLLDFFFTLKNRQDKQLFLRANPELDFYFRHFVKASATGDPELDKKVEAYFALPQHSQARSDYLRQHRDVQRYFDKHSTPADRAMRSLLEVYFGKTGRDRKDFGLRHPEIQAYFDKRKAERDREQSVGEAFAKADPRLAEFWTRARVDITVAGQLVAESQRRDRVHAGGLSARRDRSR